MHGFISFAALGFLFELNSFQGHNVKTIDCTMFGHLSLINNRLDSKHDLFEFIVGFLINPKL